MLSKESSMLSLFRDIPLASEYDYILLLLRRTRFYPIRTRSRQLYCTVVRAHMLRQVPVVLSWKEHRRTTVHGFGLPCLLVPPSIHTINITFTQHEQALHTLGLFRTRSLRSGILPPSLPMTVARSEMKMKVVA